MEASQLMKVISTQERVRRETIAILRQPLSIELGFTAFSPVISCGSVFYMPTGTAKTDGWNVWYCEEFIEQHAPTPKTLRFLILHEAVHKAYRHLYVWRKLNDIDPSLANQAMDFFVNLALVLMDPGKRFIEMLDVGVMPDAKYTGWSVAQIFRDLQKQQKEGKGQGKGQGTEGEVEGQDEHDWEGAQALNKEEQQARETEVGRAVRQGEMLLNKLRSKLGMGDAQGTFNDLNKNDVDWRQRLREFLLEQCSGHDDSSWRKANRRFVADDILLPSLSGVAARELVLGWDTSGSCFGTQTMSAFATEVKNIVMMLKPEKVHCIYWDTRVAAHQTFENGGFSIADLKPEGGGGTNGAVLFDYLREKRIVPEAIVQFTDGYVGDWGKTDVPTLWAVTGNMVAPFGTTIHIEE